MRLAGDIPGAVEECVLAALTDSVLMKSVSYRTLLLLSHKANSPCPKQFSGTEHTVRDVAGLI